jgi:putative ABC transport system ATP-binding protein/macrolide transport system ATP-binding/permease protein/lipoprotein-releasing system ATP-binding protein
LRGGKLVSIALPKPIDSRGESAGGLDAHRPIAEEAARPAFEPEPAALTHSDPTPLGEGLGRFLVGFVGWTLVIACSLLAVNHAAAGFQRRSIEAKMSKQKQAEQLALQELRADVDDVISHEDGSHTLNVYLQNFDPQKPIYVLGPSLRVFIQVDRTWQAVPLLEGDGTASVHRITTGKEAFHITFRADPQHYDELVRGYMHVRIRNVMVVGDSPDGGGDLFQRSDDYYVYLKQPNLTDDEVRRRNGWREGALVPRWIAMPAH